jgi:hypothetical protein
MEQGHVTVTFQWIGRQVSVEKDNEKRKSQEEFEDTKGVIRIHKSKKNRQHNGQKKKYKRTNNYLQDIHIKLKIE